MSESSFLSTILKNSPLSAILGRDADEDETRIYSTDEIGTRRSTRRRGEPEELPQARDFSVERAAEIIDNLPPDVPRESALRIVRGTLAAIGVKLEDLERSTQGRVSRLSSDIALAQNRQKELQERTRETVHALEEELRKAKEACDTVVAEEEEKISRASSALKEVRRVCAFFGFKMEGEENTGSTDEDTQVFEPLDPDRTQVIRRSTLFADTGRPTDDRAEGSSAYGPLHERADER